MIRWEMYADESGALIVERHADGWQFVPTGKVGRPKKEAPIPQPENPLDLLPFDIERLEVVACT